MNILYMFTHAQIVFRNVSLTSLSKEHALSDNSHLQLDPSEIWSAPDRLERWRQLMTWFAPKPGERVLDIGFGHGEALRFIARQVGSKGRAVGIELDLGTVFALNEVAMSEGSASPIGLPGDAQHLPFDDEAFDAVLCVNVLEAVVDRMRALKEMRRVLKPGGRILLAHDDYESQVYSCADRELCRRVVRAYADSTFKSYANSDGQMGRRLWGMFSAAGFVEPELRILPLINTEYREQLLGWTHAQFSAEFVSGVSNLTQQDIEGWQAGLTEANQRGEYVYCLNLYVCLGRK